MEGLGVSQCTAHSLNVCVHVHIFQPLRISRHIKQTFIVHLLMCAHPSLCADLIPSVCAYVRPDHCPGHGVEHWALSQCITVMADVSSSLSPGSRCEPIEMHSAAASGTLHD